jgi:hypothetical protein
MCKTKVTDEVLWIFLLDLLLLFQSRIQILADYASKKKQYRLLYENKQTIKVKELCQN